MFQDKKTQSVAEAVKKVMEAELSAKQKKIAAVAGDPKKIDAQDFKKLRGEEVEQVEEAAMKSGAQSRREVDAVMDKYGLGSKQKEAPKSNTRVVAGKSYGADYKDPEGADDADDKKPEAGSKKSVKKGVFKRRYNTKAYAKESFTGLLNDYKNGGVKSLLESLEVVEVEEEVSNDEYTAELKDAQAKSEGKGKKAEVAKAAVQAVKNEEVVDEEYEQMDEDEMAQQKREKVVTVKHKDSGKELRIVKTAVADYQKRGYHPVKHGKYYHDVHEEVVTEEVEQMDERHLTADETATKEKNVKSMKKNLAGFKERYGKRAKEVMYATATKQAKEA
jgi:hypothetical protein